MRIQNFSFSELSISASEIEELMGFEPGQSPEPFPGLIKQALELAPEFCSISGGFQIFGNVCVHPENKTIQIENQEFHPGKIVVTQWKEATKAAVFVCTAGEGISNLAAKKAAEGNEMLAYVLDVTGTVTVEKAAAALQEKIRKEAATEGLDITDAFSPGYCNWNVAEQHKLFSLLPTGFCGISLSDSSLMHPIKSVSGITGIGTGCQQKGYQCNWCNDRQCIYGKIRRRKKTKKNL